MDFKDCHRDRIFWILGWDYRLRMSKFFMESPGRVWDRRLQVVDEARGFRVQNLDVSRGRCRICDSGNNVTDCIRVL